MHRVKTQDKGIAYMFFGGFLCENVAGQSLVIVFSLFNWHENKDWKNILIRIKIIE